MIATCGSVYVKSVQANVAKIEINSRRCERLREGQYYDYGKGLLVHYGLNGEFALIRRNYSKHYVLYVPLADHSGIDKNFLVENLGRKEE